MAGARHAAIVPTSARATQVPPQGVVGSYMRRFLLVVGDKEASEGKVSVRTRGKGDEGQVATAEFVARVTKLIGTKAPEIG